MACLNSTSNLEHVKWDGKTGRSRRGPAKDDLQWV